MSAGATESGRSSSRVAVIGAGAIGGVVAAELQAAGHDVTLCVRRPLPRLTIESAGGVREVPLRIATDPTGIAPVPWLFVATKAQDTAGAAPWLAQLASAGTTVVILQNGVDLAERVAPYVGAATVLPTVVYLAAERTAPGHIVHRHSCRFVVPPGAAADGFAELALGSAMEIVADADFVSAAWSKLLGNIVANPLTALTLQRVGILRDPDMRALALDLLREAVAVAQAEGARVSVEETEQALQHYAASTDGGTSMLYDRLAGLSLEHEYLTGAVVRAAERHGIEAPVNRAILALLRAIDRATAAASA